MPFEIIIKGHETKEELAGATCVLPISVDQDYHKGLVFAEALRQLNTTFANIMTVVANTLQRNTHILNGVPIEKANEIAF